MPMDFEVTDNIKYDILLGRDWLIKTACETIWRSGEFTFYYNGRQGKLNAYEVEQIVKQKKHVTIQDEEAEEEEYEEEWDEDGSQEGELLQIEQEVVQIFSYKEWKNEVENNEQLIPVEHVQEGIGHELMEITEESFNDLKIGSEISVSQKEQFKSLFLKYAKRFAYQLEDLERCMIDPLKIDVQDSVLIKMKAYRIPFGQADWLKSELAKLEKLDFIRKCFGPWSTSIFLAKKKDNKWRIVQDFRPINKIARKDAGAVPNIPELLDRLAGKQWYSAMDLWTVYWQWQLDEGSQEITGFNTPFGNYCWKVAPMGFTNVPPAFQRLMWNVFDGYINVFIEILMDDIIVYSETFEEHLNHLELAFKRLEKAKLCVKAAKCQFGMN